MTWSYDGDPANSDLDAVRREIGDTNTNDQLLSNEEVNFALDQEGDSITAASARCCEWLMREYAKQADKTIGQLNIMLSQKSARYEAMATKLRKKGIKSALAPYVGGLSETERDTDEDDTDLIQPIFTKDIFTNS